jgi:hypothetical protein
MSCQKFTALGFLLLINCFALFAQHGHEHCYHGHDHGHETGAEHNGLPGHTIEFPNTGEEIQTLNHTRDKVLYTIHLMEGESQGEPFLYSLAYHHLPDRLKDLIGTDPGFLDIALRAILVGAANQMDAQDIQISELANEPHHGIEASWVDPLTTRSRIFKVNDFIFLITAGGKNLPREQVDQFLNSFIIL